MNIFVLELNGKIYKQFRNMQDALKVVELLISTDSTINIYVEEYNDDLSYCDLCCHKYSLYLYKDNKVQYCKEST